jgi:hypothetical protein
LLKRFLSCKHSKKARSHMTWAVEGLRMYYGSRETETKAHFVAQLIYFYCHDGVIKKEKIFYC